jgi:integrase
MRRDEILNLVWDKVVFPRSQIILLPEDTKDREPRIIPIFPELAEILKRLPRGLHGNHVFLFKGKPISDIYAALKTACQGAKIPYGRKIPNGFVFHDLRHTFVTVARKAGVPESVIMRITGHSTREMFDRYNFVDEQDAIIAGSQLAVYFSQLKTSAK